METKSMTKEEVLFDTLEYYTVNPSERRSIMNGDGLCSYISENPQCSEGCAIGRLVTREQAELLQKGNYSIGFMIELGKNHLERTFNGYLPNWLLKHGRNFLMKLQDLHDTEHFWDFENNCLSQEGKEFVNQLCIDENINTSKIEKFIS